MEKWALRCLIKMLSTATIELAERCLSEITALWYTVGEAWQHQKIAQDVCLSLFHELEGISI